MNDKRIEICENDGGSLAAFPKRSISQWGDNTISSGDIRGFKPGKDKIKILQLFVGYSNEQIASENFQAQLRQDNTIFHQQLGSKHFDFGYVNKNMNIGIDQRQRTAMVSFNPLKLPEMIKLELAINKAYPNVDVVAIRVNPAIADQTQMTRPSHLGIAHIGLDTFVAAGPDLSGQHKYSDLSSAFTVTHELAHILSGFTKGAGMLPMGGIHVGDSYSYTTYSYREISSGRHSELTLAPNIESIPKYYPNGLSPGLAEAIKQFKPKIADTGFQCTEKSWFGKDVVHPVYTLNPGPDIMEQVFTNGQLLSGMQIVTPMQKALFNGIASEYLKKEGRLPNDSAAVDVNASSQILPQTSIAKNHLPSR